MKRKIAVITGAILLFWLGISTYYYVQNYVLIKTCTVYEKVDFGDESLYITELRWDNFDRVSMYSYEYKDKIPWYINLVINVNMPKEITLPFIRICSFYNKHYIKYDDKGYLAIKGLRLKDVNNDVEDLEKFFERYKFYLNIDKGEILIGNKRGIMSGGANILYFYQKISLAPEQILNASITVEDTITGISKIIQVTPQWQSKGYSYFDNKPGEHDFAAKITARNFIKSVMSNRKEKAEQLILPQLQSTFPWSRLQHEYRDQPYKGYMFYENNYSGFTNVYSYNIHYVGEDSPGSDTVGSQKIYLIYRRGEWKIIDVSPLITA